MTRTLVVCRHAKSAWPDDVDDFERPLTERGERDAPEAGRWLAERVPDIGFALCSPAKRARRTWQLIADVTGKAETRHDKRLYGASAGELIAVLNELPDEAETALLVGHNPGLEDLVAVLTGAPHELKTAEIAVLSGTGSWSQLEPGWATLQETATPRG
ncbi:histidine phosphatase family protein [Saccharopolyspora gloriosae]|uniref:SixA phosphatase family protein n=1 Tax=Saccharopolyspora gloriosae TaxID=455344 RepID=UPI001FB84195|nr:histidine phosphatase family protein [Saccharopolyspora gloriosae]